eukprot:scaffold15380_cov79-Phaeocystis_antarctica.AAC.1
MSARVRQGWLQACGNCEDDTLVCSNGSGIALARGATVGGVLHEFRAAYTARLPHRGLAFIPALPQNIS